MLVKLACELTKTPKKTLEAMTLTEFTKMCEGITGQPMSAHTIRKLTSGMNIRPLRSDCRARRMPNIAVSRMCARIILRLASEYEELSDKDILSTGERSFLKAHSGGHPTKDIVDNNLDD